jgi:dolichyl-phosphate mannosyltransferase polypeptide 3
LILPQITDSSPIPSILPLKVQVEIIPVLPFWALITLASYLVGRLGLGVMTFNDCNDAYTELMAQIDTAKSDLKVRSVGTD